MTAEEKATWEFLFNTPSISLLKHGSSYSDFVEAVTSDRKNAFKSGAEWQKEETIEKACEWLLKNDSYAKPTEVLVRDLRKAMEE